MTRSEPPTVASAIAFPAVQPPGYEWLDDEPIFDPAAHLEIRPPAAVTTLAELGYSEDEICPTATAAAFSEPFRILSDVGAGVLLDVARRLRPFAAPAGDRIQHTVRGGCYRSRWLRDLCLSPEVTDVMAGIYGTDVAPHTMPLHLGHLNFEPTEVGEAVDKWHHDTLPLDFVMMVSDPAACPVADSRCSSARRRMPLPSPQPESGLRRSGCSPLNSVVPGGRSHCTGTWSCTVALRWMLRPRGSPWSTAMWPLTGAVTTSPDRGTS